MHYTTALSMEISSLDGSKLRDWEEDFKPSKLLGLNNYNYKSYNLKFIVTINYMSGYSRHCVPASWAQNSVKSHSNFTIQSFT